MEFDLGIVTEHPLHNRVVDLARKIQAAKPKKTP